MGMPLWHFNTGQGMHASDELRSEREAIRGHRRGERHFQFWVALGNERFQIIFTPRRTLKCLSIAAQEEALPLVWPRFCPAWALRESPQYRRRRRLAASRNWTVMENLPERVLLLR